MREALRNLSMKQQVFKTYVCNLVDQQCCPGVIFHGCEVHPSPDPDPHAVDRFIFFVWIVCVVSVIHVPPPAEAGNQQAHRGYTYGEDR